MLLAIQPGAIGDFILALPALRALRLGPGSGGMEIWAERANLSLVEHAAYADRVRPLAETGLDRYPLPAAALDAIRAFQQVVSWRGAGFDELREQVLAAQPRACFLPQFPPADAAIHMIEFRGRQLAGLLAGQRDALEALSAAPQIFFAPEDAQAAARLLGEEEELRPLVVLHPGSSGRRKRWPAAGFAVLAQDAARDWQARVLITEGPLDRQAVAEVLSLAAGSGAAPLRVANLRHLAAVLRRVRLFAGNDSGIAHLAAAAGAPTLAIFQATDPRLWAPRGRAVRVLHRPSIEEARQALHQALAGK
jgi:ADP-heptose:LPS heptosyltransferase